MTATFRRDSRHQLTVIPGSTRPSVTRHVSIVLCMSVCVCLFNSARAQTTASTLATQSGDGKPAAASTGQINTGQLKAGQTKAGDTKSSDPNGAITPLDPAGMRKELERLDIICQRIGLMRERELMSRWLSESPDDAQRFYLPIEADPLAAKSSAASPSNDKQADDKHDNWLKYFATARSRHAEYWYQQAEKQAAGDEWAAYRALWRAAREDESHPATKRTLGPMLTALNVKTRPKTINAVHNQLKWPAGSYSRMETANFRLTSRADAKTTIEIANQLETFYALWTQIFYPLWAAPNVTSSRVAGRNTNWSRRNACEVILCKDRDDYIKTLGISEANIGVSVGYYNPEAKMSFFYPDAQLDATLYHELTHQLLSEVSQLKSRDQPGEERDFWIVEGVALHSESLRRNGLDWSLGGWLSPRMQTARYRSLHDGYWIEWEKLSESGLAQWKSNPEIGKLYSHASGLSHYFLDERLVEVPEERGSDRPEPPVVSFDGKAAHAAYYYALVAVYQGNRGATDKLQSLMGGADAQKNYVNYLLVRDRHVQSLSTLNHDTLTSIKDLVLTRSQLAASSWPAVGKLTNLQWLDCSFSNATTADLAWIDELVNLERLSVEGTSIDGTLIAKIARLPNLTELDLSQCKQVDDQAMKALARHPKLQTLWLTGTAVSSESVPIIESMPRLNFVDVSSTMMEKAEADALTKRVTANQRR